MAEVAKVTSSSVLKSTDILAPLMFIGGPGGSQHSINGWESGKVISKIRVWSGPSQIKAIKIWLTGDEDSDATLYGSPDATDYRDFQFNDGELVTKMSLWGNGNGTRAGWLYFETDQGRSFDYGMYSWGRKTEYPVDVGSGILVGCIVNAGADIDALGFYFLNPVDRLELTNMQYPTVTFDSAGITPESLETFSDTNSSSIDITWSFSGSKTKTTEVTWSITAGLTVHSTISVTGQVPEIAEVKEEFGWELSESETYQTTQTNETVLDWSESGTLKPGETIELEALTRNGSLNVPYTGTMVVYLKNGTSFSYDFGGTYTGLCYTGVEIVDGGK